MIRELDDRIDSVIQGAVTECELQDLCKWIVHNAFGNQSEDHAKLVSDLRDMLVAKLVSGEHTPEDGETGVRWRKKVDKALEDTIGFFDGPGGIQYAERYEHAPIGDFVTRICQLIEDGASHEPKALDMGWAQDNMPNFWRKMDTRLT